METNTSVCDPQYPCYDFATIIDPPYVMAKEDGSGRYEGMVVDLLHKLAHMIGFRFRLKVASGSYGHLEPNGSWTGLIGNVNTLPANMVVGALAVGPERSQVLQMTERFHSSSVQLMLLRPRGEGEGPGAGLLLAPFTPAAWLLVALAFLLVSAGLFLIGRFSPHSNKARAAAEDSTRGVRHSSGLTDSLLATVSTLAWQGNREAPRSPSGQVLAASWWLFVVLVLLSYLSSLTALVSLRPHLRPALPFRTYWDILRDKSVELGVVRHGDAHQVLRTSEDMLQKQLLEFITSRENFFPSLAQALERMRQAPRDRLALLVPTYKAHYLTSYQCDVITHGHGLGMIQYAFGVPAENHLEAMRRRINSAILVLRETGELDELSRKWQYKGSYCPDPEGSSLHVTLERGGSSLPFMALGPRDLAVAFLVLLLFAFLSACLAVGEIVHGKRVRKKRDQNHEGEGGTAVTPLFSKGRGHTDPDTVVILDVEEEESTPDKTGNGDTSKSTDGKICNSTEDEGKTAHNDTKADVDKDTPPAYHDVTVHLVA